MYSYLDSDVTLRLVCAAVICHIEEVGWGEGITVPSNYLRFFCFPGYMEVVQIPKGSVHIEIREVAVSKNYIGEL